VACATCSFRESSIALIRSSGQQNTPQANLDRQH
jgi:hypothetical protein